MESDSSLRNIATGVTVDETVTAEKAKEVGYQIIGTMEGRKWWTTHSRKRNMS